MKRINTVKNPLHFLIVESLNIKGNVIGDQGMILLAQSLQYAPNLKELDVSLNEIGPTGFQMLCEVLPQTNL